MVVQVEMKQVSERKKVDIIFAFFFLLFFTSMYVGNFCCRQILLSNACILLRVTSL